MEGPESGVALNEEARRQAGIETRALGTASRASTVQLAGELVADPGQVTTVQAPVAGRLAAVENGHWPAFGEWVPTGTVLGQVSDAKPLVAARGGAVTRVGAQPGEIVQTGQELLELTDFSHPLARVVWRPAAPLPAPPALRIAPVLGAGSGTAGPPATFSVEARLVGPASTADSLTRLPVFLYRATQGWPGASPGTPVEATVFAGGSVSRGLFVPAAAAVQWQGLVWVYVERPARANRRDEAGQPVLETAAHYSYVRARVDTDHPVPGGWLLTGPAGQGGLAAGEAVVVRGAQQLLSEEFRGQAATGDEDQK